MDYNAQMIARADHNLMVRSLPAVPEFGEHIVTKQAVGLSQQAGRLFFALKHWVALVRNPLKREQDRGLSVTLPE